MLELENRLLIMVTVHFTGGRASTPIPSGECTRVWMKPADSSRRLWCGTTRFTVDVICTKIKHLSGSLSTVDTLCHHYLQLATGVRFFGGGASTLEVPAWTLVATIWALE